MPWKSIDDNIDDANTHANPFKQAINDGGIPAPVRLTPLERDIEITCLKGSE